MDPLTQGLLGGLAAHVGCRKKLGPRATWIGVAAGMAPDLDVVIDHMADCEPEDLDGRKILTDLARFERVYVKISHTWSISNEAYPWKDTHPLAEAVYQAFGAQRIMWGTDWPVCLSKAEFGQTLSVVRDEMKFIAAEDLDWVLGKTALRLWPFKG